MTVFFLIVLCSLIVAFVATVGAYAAYWILRAFAAIGADIIDAFTNLKLWSLLAKVLFAFFLLVFAGSLIYFSFNTGKL